MSAFLKNKNLLLPLGAEPHAFARFRIDASKYGPELIEDIAIGQSLGAWEESHVDAAVLREKVAKIVSTHSDGTYHWADVAFPWNLWQGRLNWLVTILFGKMSFYEGIQLSDLRFTQDCFERGPLVGPRHGTAALRAMAGAPEGAPMLMGILKPNVAMSSEKIASLFQEAAEAGIHLLKDDEIRHDARFEDILERVERVADAAERKNLKTIYVPHLQLDGDPSDAQLRALVDAGARALLINVWPNGLGALQRLRLRTDLVLMAHPALAGAFGIQDRSATIHPRVSLGQAMRAAGADLTLFPSPYGKLGLPKDVALAIAQTCLDRDQWKIEVTTPVPSAGLKPEHGPAARADFGTEHVLNAGTGIFAGKDALVPNIKAFLAGLGPGEEDGR